MLRRQLIFLLCQVTLPAYLSCPSRTQHSRCVDFNVALPSDAPHGSVFAMLVSVFGQQLLRCSVPVCSGIVAPLSIPQPRGFECAISSNGQIYVSDFYSIATRDSISVYDSDGLRIGEIDGSAFDVDDILCFSLTGGDDARVLVGAEDRIIAIDANTLDVRWSNSTEVECFNVTVLSRQGIVFADVGSALTLYRLSDGASLGI